MKQVRQAFAWIFLLNKRLFKKPGFLIILILVLGLVYAVGLMEQETAALSLLQLPLKIWQTRSLWR